MADPTVVVDNLHVVYRVYGAGGNKGTAATSFMRLVKRQRRVSIREVHAIRGISFVAYRGDGFLAAFGAPIEIEDHADLALATARNMVDVRLPRFNKWLRSKGLGEGVAMGVGLNSGPFMSGNVGSLRRLEYTVHGDTVNTAARIESLTKTLAGPILLSESTRAALLRPPGDLRAVTVCHCHGMRPVEGMTGLFYPDDGPRIGRSLPPLLSLHGRRHLLSHREGDDIADHLPIAALGLAHLATNFNGQLESRGVRVEV